jgi:hypothetical protein
VCYRELSVLALRPERICPYLFIITLSVLLHDVEAESVEVHKYNPWVFSSYSPMWDLEYVDDTVIITKDAATMERLLHTLQKIGYTHGFELNMSE